MKKFMGTLFLFFSGVYASDSTYTLLVSTWPSHAELYVGERPSNFETEAPFTTPAKLQLPLDSTTVRITLFKPDHVDTTIDIQVKSPRDSYVMLMLQPELDASVIEQQQRLLSKRNRNLWGKRIAWGSSIPLAISGIFAIIAEYQFNAAENYAKRIDNSTIRSGDNFDQMVQKYTDKKKSGKDFRNYAFASLCVGSTLLLTGLILSF